MSDEYRKSRKSGISRIILSARNHSVSRRCPGGHKKVGQGRRRRKSKSAENQNKSKVSHKSIQSVSQIPVSQPEVPWRKKIGGPVASSKEIPVSQKPNQVERQKEVETTQSAGSALAATSRFASGVVEGSPSQLKTEKSRNSATSRVSLSARNQSVNRICPGGHN